MLVLNLIYRFGYLLLLNYIVHGIDIKQGEFIKNSNDLSKTPQFSFSTASKYPCLMQCSAKLWCKMACLEDSVCNLYDYSPTPTSSTPSVPCYFYPKRYFSLVENVNVYWIEDTPRSTPRLQRRTPLTNLENCLGRCMNQALFDCTTVCVTNTECVETDMLMDPRFDEALVSEDGINVFASAELMNCYTTLDSNNLIIGQSSQTFLFDAAKKGPDYLTMGLFSGDRDKTCLKLYDHQGPWFVIEFSSPVSFNTIRLRVQNYDMFPKWLPVNVKIFVADSYNGNNDFSNDPHYQLICTLPNTLETDQTYEFSVSVSNTKLIAFKKEAEVEKFLSICYLEIY